MKLRAITNPTTHLARALIEEARKRGITSHFALAKVIGVNEESALGVLQGSRPNLRTVKRYKSFLKVPNFQKLVYEISDKNARRPDDSALEPASQISLSTRLKQAIDEINGSLVKFREIYQDISRIEDDSLLDEILHADRKTLVAILQLLRISSGKAAQVQQAAEIHEPHALPQTEAPAIQPVKSAKNTKQTTRTIRHPNATA
jgi:hypothetical protein